MGVHNGEPKASHCKAHTDRTRIFCRTCEKKRYNEGKVFLCDSVIGHTCQNIIGPTGESARDKKLLTIHNLQSLVNRGYGDRSFSEEIALLSETVPKNTKCNTKWTVNLAEHEIEQKSAVGNSWRERT